MEGKSSFFVLVGIVAFLSLSLALLAVYVFFVQDRSPEAAQGQQNTQIVVPNDDELVREKLFDEKTLFNLKNDDESNKTPVIVVSIEVWYYGKVNGIKDTTLKFVANKSRLQEIVGTYFQGLKIQDVSDASAKENVRNDLVRLMNDALLENEKGKNNIIYTVVFDQWFYQ